MEGVCAYGWAGAAGTGEPDRLWGSCFEEPDTACDEPLLWMRC